jgi:glycosyltransferase 2 family protein
MTLMAVRAVVAKRLIALLKVMVTCAAISLVLRRYDGSQLMGVVRHAEGFWLMAAALIALGQLGLLAWRWQLLHRLLTGTSVPFRALVSSIGRSMLLGQMLPAVVGADAIRIATIAGRAGLPNAVRSVVGDRLLGLCSLLAMTAAMLPFCALRIGAAAVAPQLVLACAGGAAAIAAGVAWPGAFRRLPLIGRFIAQPVADMRLTFRSAIGRRAIVISFLAHLFGVAIFAALVASLASDVSIGMCLLIMGPIMLISSIPISLNGWGVREAAIASAFALIGADPLIGTAASILYGLSGPLVGAAGALYGLIPVAMSTDPDVGLDNAARPR